MHFLAHHHAQRGNLSPEFAFGLMIPDLVPGFTKVYNRYISKHPSFSSDMLSIHQGINAHFGDDKLFHAKIPFETMQHQLVAILVESSLDRTQIRLSVIAHLLVEILLDRWLTEQHPSLPQSFYHTLEQLNEQCVHLYFDAMSLEKEKHISLERRQWFLNHRFLLQLHNSEQMAIGVSRIYERTTGRAITKNEQFRIIDAINSFYALPLDWKALLIR